MKNQTSKNIKKYTFILTLILVLVFGASFAWLTLVINSDAIHVLKAGELKLYIDEEDDGIYLQNAIPQSYDQGLTNKVYEYKLVNEGTTKVNYKLSLEDLEIPSTAVRMDDSKVRYYLLKDGKAIEKEKNSILKFISGNWDIYFDGTTVTKIITLNNGQTLDGPIQGYNNAIKNSGVTTTSEAMDIVKSQLCSGCQYEKIIVDPNTNTNSYLLSSASDRVIDSGVIYPNDEIIYKLQVWIDSKAENEVMDQTFAARVKIDTEQAGGTPKKSCSWKFESDENNNGVIDFGDLISACDQEFYVFKNDGSNIRVLAKRNLNVAYYRDQTFTEQMPLDATNDTSNIQFTEEGYWSGIDGDLIELNNPNNLIYPHLTSYYDTLRSYGLKINEMTLITKQELEEIGCDSKFNYNGTYNACENAPEWVYNQAYYTRTSWSSSSSVWVVYYQIGMNAFDGARYAHFIGTSALQGYNGIRPVLSIPVSVIKK